jgi:hypothetical protein
LEPAGTFLCSQKAATRLHPDVGKHKYLLLSAYLIKHKESDTFLLRFEVFTAVTMKNAVFWDVTLFGASKNQRFRGTHCLHHKGDKNQRAISQILVTLMEAMCSSEMSVPTRATWCNIPEDGILDTFLLYFNW